MPGADRLPDGLRAHIERHATLRNVTPGTILLRQHAVAAELIVLVSGTLTTLVEFGGAGDLVVETSDRPGCVFGWSGLRPPRRATGTVRADSTGQVLVLPFDTLPDDRPRWTAALDELVSAALADRVRDLQDQTSTAAAWLDPEDGDDA